MKRLLVVVGVTVLGACGSVAPSPTSPEEPDPQFAFRMAFDQDVPPEHRFTWYPFPVLRTDGLLITLDPEQEPQTFPDLLLRPFVAVTIPEAGFDRIVEQARVRGLLTATGRS